MEKLFKLACRELQQPPQHWQQLGLSELRLEEVVAGLPLEVVEVVVEEEEGEGLPLEEEALLVVEEAGLVVEAGLVEEALLVEAGLEVEAGLVVGLVGEETTTTRWRSK